MVPEKSGPHPRTSPPIRQRAERKAGEMLGRLEKSEGGRPVKNSGDVAEVSEYRRVLEESKTEPTEARRWQKIAEIPEERFEVRGLYFEAWSLVEWQEKTIARKEN